METCLYPSLHTIKTECDVEFLRRISAPALSNLVLGAHPHRTRDNAAPRIIWDFLERHAPTIKSLSCAMTTDCPNGRIPFILPCHVKQGTLLQFPSLKKLDIESDDVLLSCVQAAPRLKSLINHSRDRLLVGGMGFNAQAFASIHTLEIVDPPTPAVSTSLLQLCGLVRMLVSVN